MRKEVVQRCIKNNEVLFSLAWNIIFFGNLKVLVLKFLEMKDMVFLSQKVDGNMIFTDYWKVLVLNFSMMGNTVFFESRSWWKRWYLLITEKFLFWTFWWWKIQSFFQPKSWWMMIFTWYFWAFHDIPGLGKYGFSCSANGSQYLSLSIVVALSASPKFPQLIFSFRKVRRYPISPI